jgi:hypothetical protein
LKPSVPRNNELFERKSFNFLCGGADPNQEWGEHSKMDQLFLVSIAAEDQSKIRPLVTSQVSKLKTNDAYSLNEGEASDPRATLMASLILGDGALSHLSEAAISQRFRDLINLDDIDGIVAEGVPWIVSVNMSGRVQGDSRAGASQSLIRKWSHMLREASQDAGTVSSLFYLNLVAEHLNMPHEGLQRGVLNKFQTEDGALHLGQGPADPQFTFYGMHVGGASSELVNWDYVCEEDARVCV